MTALPLSMDGTKKKQGSYDRRHVPGLASYPNSLAIVFKMSKNQENELNTKILAHASFE